jgi:hypothetical protein
MNKRELGTILCAHADALNKGIDSTAQYLNDFPDDSAELASLFQLASSVQAVLVPIRAPMTFVSRFRNELMAYTHSEIPIRTPLSAQKVLLVGVAAAGSVLSVTGLVILVLRRLKGTDKVGGQPATTAV